MAFRALGHNVALTICGTFAPGLLLIAMVLSVLPGASHWRVALAIAVSLAFHVYALVRAPGLPGGLRMATMTAMILAGILGAAAMAYGTYLAFLPSSSGDPEALVVLLGWALACSGVMTVGAAMAYGVDLKELSVEG